MRTLLIGSQTYLVNSNQCHWRVAPMTRSARNRRYQLLQTLALVTWLL